MILKQPFLIIDGVFERFSDVRDHVEIESTEVRITQNKNKKGKLLQKKKLRGLYMKCTNKSTRKLN